MFLNVSRILYALCSSTDSMKMAKSFIKVLKTHTPDVTEYREAAHAMFFARTEKKVKVLIFN